MPSRNPPPPSNDGTAAIDELFGETRGWAGAIGAAQVAVGERVTIAFSGETERTVA